MAVSLRSPPPALCVLFLLLATLSACERTTPGAPPGTAATPAAIAAGIDWNEGHVKKVFEEAQKTGKPVLLY